MVGLYTGGGGLYSGGGAYSRRFTVLPYVFFSLSTLSFQPTLLYHVWDRCLPK